MKLLALIPTLSSGGAERVLTNLANDWCARSGWEVCILTLASNQTPFYRLDERVTHIALEMERPSNHAWRAATANWHRIRAVRKILQAFQPDLAIGFMSQANVLLAFAGLGTGIPCLGSEHTHPPKIPLGRAWEALRRHTYGWLYGVTALTKESREWLLSQTRSRRCWVIPNAAPYPIPFQPPCLSPQTVGRFGKKRLLAVGRLIPSKGFDLLLYAFSKLSHLHADWDLVIVGDGELKSSLGILAVELNIPDSVFFTGTVGNIGDWYAGSDLFVLSSRYEGFGNVLAEALTHALPCVSFDCQHGPRDIMRHGIDGLLVPAEDIEALATALDQLMTDDAQRASMASRAIEARETYSIKRIHGQWDELFNRCTRDTLERHGTLND